MLEYLDKELPKARLRLEQQVRTRVYGTECHNGNLCELTADHIKTNIVDSDGNRYLELPLERDSGLYFWHNIFDPLYHLCVKGGDRGVICEGYAKNTRMPWSVLEVEAWKNRDVKPEDIRKFTYEE